MPSCEPCEDGFCQFLLPPHSLRLPRNALFCPISRAVSNRGGASCPLKRRQLSFDANLLEKGRSVGRRTYKCWFPGLWLGRHLSGVLCSIFLTVVGRLVYNRVAG